MKQEVLLNDVTCILLSSCRNF